MMKLLFLSSLLSIFSVAAQSLHANGTYHLNVADSAVVSRNCQAGDPLKDTSRPRYRTQGYRIQVFTGGNDRAAKRSAQEMKIKVQRHFPELSVYIHFQSPRWVCRVGDFLTREEAQHYVKLIRKKRLSPEAAIVKSPILRAY